MIHEIDDIDKRILNLFARRCDATTQEHCRKVHASVATCQRRIQMMTETGVITRQVVIVNPTELGFDLSAFVLIEMENKIPRFAAWLWATDEPVPNVMSCYEISGDYDFFAIGTCQKYGGISPFTRDNLTYENNVRRFKSQFVMNFSKVGTKIQLD